MGRYSTVLASEPGVPPRHPGNSITEWCLCVACAGHEHMSTFTMAPTWNADTITRGSRVANMLGIRNLRETSLGEWYAVIPQAATLEQFAREDQYGAFWTPIGFVCRACSGLPGVGHDWRSEAFVARCWCGYERAFPYDGDPAEVQAALEAYPESTVWKSVRHGKAERRATRSLRGHLASVHSKRMAVAA